MIRRPVFLCILLLVLFAVPASGELPVSFDLRDHGAVTDAKIQGDANTCWAFGVVNAAESNLLLKGYADLETVDLSEMHLAYFAYTRDSISVDAVLPELAGLRGDYVRLENGSYSDAGGNEIFATFVLASRLGLVNESVVPYAPGGETVPDASLAFALDGYHLVNSWWLGFEEPERIKELLMTCGAGSIGFYSDGSYYREDTFAHYCGDKTESTHSVGLIGWDDTFSRENFLVTPPGDGAWLVKNSWGPEFGDAGCFWISYYDTSLDNAVFFDVVPAGESECVYQYDGGILPTSMPVSVAEGAEVFTVSAANVFTAAGWDRLSAVSFFTLNENVSYTVVVSTGGMGPESMVRRTESGMARFCGYHTVVLEESLLLRPGQVFSVAVTMTAPLNTSDFFGNPGLSLPLDLMNRAEGIFSYSSSEAGQSYLFDAARGSWTDIGEHGDVNVRVKTFTTGAGVCPAWAPRPFLVIG